MLWENGWQLQGLFLSCGLGFLLGLWYDGLRLLRTLLRWGRIGTFIADVLFCVSAALCLFFFSFPLTGGAVRGYLLLGAAVGFAVYLGTIGRVSVRFCVRIGRGFVRVMRPIGRGIHAVLQRMAAPFVIIGRFGRKKTKKIAFFLKKLLHIAP